MDNRKCVCDDERQRGWKEAQTIYCSKAEAGVGEHDCLMKQDTGYCSIFTENCWKVVPTGYKCPDPSTCTTTAIGNCGWYVNCLQRKYSRQCNAYGYPIYYGYKYCNNFMKYKDNMDEKGKIWVNNVLVCLQKELISLYNHPVSCDQLKDFAISSHFKCYTTREQGINFCDIRWSNFLTLMKIYDYGKALSGKNFLESIKVWEYCNIIDPFKKLPIPRTNLYFKN